MSLKLGKSFVDALRSNNTLCTLLGATGRPLTGARIFAVARSNDEEAADIIPYIVMIPEGINTDSTKDEYEYGDTATISLLCVASSFADLITLTEMVRDTIEQKLDGTTEYVIDDYQFSANAVQMDPDKPCYFQTLTYLCHTQKL